MRIIDFDELLHSEFQKLSTTFWSSNEIIDLTIDWLELNSTSRVLDIGSGVGKFCVLGSQISDASFTGVEIRKNLVAEAKRLANKLELDNCVFIHSDVRDFDFQEYDSFFYYNPFCEHIAIDEVIDNTIEFSRENHRKYEELMFEKLKTLSVGIKIITYCSSDFILPRNYHLIKTNGDSTLALWVIKNNDAI